MNKAQTDSAAEASAAPQEERAADLCVVAELVEIQMSIARATQQEALQAPQPGADYCQRIATVSRAVRLTLLLKDKLSRQAAERRKAAAQREAAQEDWHELRVRLAMMAAAYEVSKDEEEADRRADEVCERLERPEVAELVEASRAEVAVAALCRRWGYPVQVKQWLEMADEALEELGFIRRRTARTIRRMRPSLARRLPAAASRRIRDEPLAHPRPSPPHSASTNAAFHTPPPLAGGGWGRGLRASARVARPEAG